MLTKEDLQAITGIVERVVDQNITKAFIDYDVKMDRKFASIKKDIRKVDRKLESFIRLYDTEVTDLQRRVARLEYCSGNI